MHKTGWIYTLVVLLAACTPTQTDVAEPTPFGGGGGKIAFVSRRDGDSEIYIMDADGSNLVQLTDNEWDDYSPVWQP